MKKILFLIPLLIFPISSLFAEKAEETVKEQLYLDEIDLKLTLDG